MRKLAFVALLASAGAVFAAPVINDKGVRSPAAADSSNLTQGSVFVVSGAGLGPQEVSVGTLPYDVTLGGVGITLASADGASSVQAYVAEAGAGRVVGVVPSATPAGAYKVTVSYNGESSNAVDAVVVARNFGMLTLSGNVGGLASGRVRVEGADAAPFGLTASVRAGMTLELDAAGLGAYGDPDNDVNPGTNRYDGTANLLIAGQSVPVFYLGKNPNRPGYDLVVATLPAENVPTGCYIVFQVQTPDFVTSSAALPIVNGDSATCTHPLGFSSDSLTTLAGGGSLVYGTFALTQTSVNANMYGFQIDLKSEAVTGSFAEVNLASLDANVTASATSLGMLAFNGCSVFTTPELSATAVVPGVALVDAGDPLTLSGPGGDKTVPRKDNAYNLTINANLITGIPGIPSAAGTLYLKQGSYGLSGPGGAVVGPFQAVTQANDAVTWNEKAGLTAVDRANDLGVTWSGGVTGDLIEVAGYAMGPAPEDAAKTVNRMFVCVAPAEVGGLTVPAAILQKMPAAAGLSGDNAMSALLFLQTNIAGVVVHGAAGRRRLDRAQRVYHGLCHDEAGAVPVRHG